MLIDLSDDITLMGGERPPVMVPAELLGGDPGLVNIGLMPFGTEPLLMGGGTGVVEDDFITLWDTTLGNGTTTINVPLVNGVQYTGTISWGDGSTETFNSNSISNLTHVYSSGGQYSVRISGTFPRIFFNNGGDRLKLIGLVNWGNIVWASMDRAFFGCANMQALFSDLPNFSAVTSYNEAFRACPIFIPAFSQLDVSAGVNFTAMFFGCDLWNVDISGWQIQNATSMAAMLNGTNFSTTNYNLLLAAWSQLSVQSSVAFGADFTAYTIATAQADRDVLTGAPNLWTITDDGGTSSDASFVVYTDVPTNMTTGQMLSISITMLNLGPTTWTAAGQYKLGSRNPQDNTTWGMNRVLMDGGDSVAPGQTKTFTFTITAPAVPGDYNFQWRMVQDGVSWFGSRSTNRVITVS